MHFLYLVLANCHLPFFCRFVSVALQAGPLDPNQGGFYMPIVPLKGKQSSPTMGHWGCMSLLISEAQSVYSSALHQSQNEQKILHPESCQG